VNFPLVAAGCLAVAGAAIHGVGGEVLVVRKLSPGSAKAMIHVTWHLTTVAFLAVGAALLLSGSVLDGDAARGIGIYSAGTTTGFAAVAVGLGAAHARSPRSLFRHPGPALLTVTAALAWWGAL
jgi:hypothetical protein